MAEDELAALLPTLRRLPRRVDRIADAVEHGRLSLNVRLLADRRDRRLVADLLHQVVLTVLGATIGLMGVLLPTHRRRPAGDRTGRPLLGYALLIVVVVLVLRVLVVIFRRGPT